MQKWETTTVQELIDRGMLEKPLDGNHGAIHPKVSDYVPVGVPFIMANNLVDGEVDFNDCCFISEEQVKTLKKGFSKPGDVLLTHKATIGRTAVVDESYPLIILTPQVTYYRVKSGINNKYLKYYFDSEFFQKTISSWAGSGSTRAYIGITEQCKLPIILPDLETQNRIAEILDAFDAKIKHNKKMNLLLEKQLQALFYEYCIDETKIPEGWKKSNLTEIAEYLNGLAMQKFRPEEGAEALQVMKIRELRQGYFDESSELCSTEIKPQYIIDDGDVIFSWSGSLLVDLWCGGKGGLNQHLFKVTSDKYDKWYIYCWTKYHLAKFQAVAEAKATTMGHIKREDLRSSEVIVLPDGYYAKVSAMIAPILDLIEKNKIENKNLAKIRDSILPNLMNGKIEL